MTSIKCVVVGDGAVGKSCLLIRFTNRFFPGEYVPSVIEYYAATIKVDGLTVALTLIDTAGQSEYDRMRHLSYPDTDVVLICFSLVCPASLEHAVTKWGAEVRDKCRPDTPVLLVGTKCDVRDKRTPKDDLRDDGKWRAITYHEGLVAAKKLGAIGYLECSSLVQDSVNKVFEEAIRATLNYRSKSQQKNCAIQ